MEEYLAIYVNESAKSRNCTRSPFFNKRYRYVAKHEISGNRRVQISIFRLRTGHCMLRYTRSRFDKKCDPWCRRCEKNDIQTEESIEHVMLECVNMNQEVKNARNQLIMEMSESRMLLADFMISPLAKHYHLLENLVDALLRDNILI